MSRRALLVCFILPLLALSSCSPPRPNHPIIGAKNFTEQVVLGELLAQEIEAKSNLKVERRFYLAGSYICNQALVAGRIDAYVEYTGTALTADPQAVRRSQPGSGPQHGPATLCVTLRHYRRRAARIRKHLCHGHSR